MDAGGSRSLAFRLYGKFHWPPVRSDYDESTDDTGKEFREGLVEIYYGAPDKNVRFGFLRWVSKSLLKDGEESPEFTDDLPLESIRALDDARLHQAFRVEGPVVLRLGGGTGTPVSRDRHLLFRGAFLFEQLMPPEKLGAPQALHMRLPLSRAFLHDKKNYFSELVVGQRGDDLASGSRIRFNLALPTPRPQSGKAGQPECFALPFAAIFTATQPKDAETPPPVERFVAGPGPASATQDIEKKKEGVRLADTIIPPKSHSLGLFGFCGRDGGREFLYFPRHRKSSFHSFWVTVRSAPSRFQVFCC